VSQPLAGQSSNLLDGFGQIASKQDVVDATAGVQDSIGDIFDQLDGFGTQIDDATAAAAAAQAAADAAAAAANDAVDVADLAVASAQYWKDEFVVSSAGLLLGKNEMVLGMVMDVPSPRTRTVTRVHYALLTNTTTTLTIQLIKVNAAGTVETVILTTNITGGAIRRTDSTINEVVLDTERILCNVTAITGGVASGLQCAVVGTFL
jgi:hypothetical protein